MYREEILLKVRQLFVDRLSREGFVLVDVRFYKAHGDLILEALVDRAEGGITLDECARLNRELGDALEGAGYVQESYTLDVSSPGLDRPLSTSSDFHRALGKKIRVFLREPVEEKIEWLGSIESAYEDRVIINTGTKTIEIPYEKIAKAKQVIT